MPIPAQPRADPAGSAALVHHRAGRRGGVAHRHSVQHETGVPLITSGSNQGEDGNALRRRADGIDLRIGGDGATPPRLPMTLNLVFRAKEPDDASLTCADIARRWLAMADMNETGAQLAARLREPGGALASIRAANIDRIETNLQIAHIPKSDKRAFRTDYLQKVFRRDASTKVFREAPLENQIDRDRLLVDDGLRRDFKDWLLDPRHVAELDRGTLLIPERFLATFSVAATPAGLARSALQPGFGLMQGDSAGSEAVFAE
eukprot:gene35572-47835_t